MNHFKRGSGVAALVEMSEVDLAALLRVRGLDAFSSCANAALTIEGVGAASEEAFYVSLLRFAGGVLKLTRGKLREAQCPQYFLAVDFHDYREAVLDQRIVEDAYLRFARFAQCFCDFKGGFNGIRMHCCPDQGTAYASVESDSEILDSASLREFLISYFESGKVTLDLHRAFGEATTEFAKATVPSLVSSIVL